MVDHIINSPINDKLKRLEKSGRIPFHMPGHKRKSDRNSVFHDAKSIDITEITGYDNLHAPEGMIRESMDQLKKIYHTRESWYLINGSTAGILAAVSSAVSPGDKILITRNCHKSVYNAIRLLQLRAVYLYPACSKAGGICLDVGAEEREQLQRILMEEGDIRAVVITSPDYEGVVTDVAAVRRVISDYDDRIPLIVDEAHGAHLIFHDAFPESAVECGADIVVQSLHKTLPALTQTALLHLCTDRVAAESLYDWLSVFETSSPSYVLMASAEEAVFFMARHRQRLQKYVDDLRRFRDRCKDLSCIHLMEGEELPVYAYDCGKLVFSIRGKKEGGRWLFDRLRDDWNLELEMAGRDYCLAMTSVMDEEEDFDKLFFALSRLDEELAGKTEEEDAGISEDTLARRRLVPAIKVLESFECAGKPVTALDLPESVGRIAASYVMVYPPGIPLLVPGEKIVKETVENLIYYVYNGYNVQGLYDGKIQTLIL